MSLGEIAIIKQPKTIQRETERKKRLFINKDQIARERERVCVRKQSMRNRLGNWPAPPTPSPLLPPPPPPSLTAHLQLSSVVHTTTFYVVAAC